MIPFKSFFRKFCSSTPPLVCDCQGKITRPGSTFSLQNLPDLDLNYLCNPDNFSEIKSNIKRRKASGNIERVLELHRAYKNSREVEKPCTYEALLLSALRIPNKSSPSTLALGEEPQVIKYTGTKRSFTFKPLTFDVIGKKLKLVRTDQLSHFTGPRSYYLIDQLATLEQALIAYSIKKLLKKGFELISVPDILPKSVIEACGMSTRGERNQVYSLSDALPEDLCLSGTAEMGIASYLIGRNIPESELPLRCAAVSRCYRAETSKVSEEKGIYRVHQFTKVEMFGVTKPSQSNELLEEFREIQEENFCELGLHVRTLDMPPEELGAQAFRKYDVEAYMVGKKMWGELSSASDCTDYQARRLGLKSGSTFLHTVNGTACAVPRLIIAIVETHQNSDHTINIPKPLVELMGVKSISQSRTPNLKPFYKGMDER